MHRFDEHGGRLLPSESHIKMMSLYFEECKIFFSLSFYGFILGLSSEVHSSAAALRPAPEEPEAHFTALWLSINPASMKSQGANAVKRANLPLYTISSYTEALAPALPEPPPPSAPTPTCLQKCSSWTKWLYHLGPLFHLCCCFSWNPFQAVSPPTQAKFEKWKKGTMQSEHILQPAGK